MKHQEKQKIKSKDKLVGAFAVSWVNATEDSLPQNQMQILEIVGDYVLVQYFSWIMGEATTCGLHSLEDIHRDNWTIFLDHEYFIWWLDENVHKPNREKNKAS